MHRLKLLLWIAAWSGWAWLGVGLHRELPRLGSPSVCKIELDDERKLLGFVGPGSHVALVRKSEKAPTTVEIIDAETGAIVGSAPGPRISNYFEGIWSNSFRDVVIARRAPNIAGEMQPAGLYLLDSTTWTWRQLSKRTPIGATLHDSKPWLLFVDGHAAESPTVVVMDFETGKEVFTRKLPAKCGGFGPPRYIPGSERLFISMSTNPRDPDDDAAKAIEIWRIADPPILEKTVHGAGFSWPMSVGANGTVAYAEAANIPYWSVFDLESEKILYDDPPRSERFPIKAWGMTGVMFGTQSPKLSPSGKSLYCPTDSKLIDVFSKAVRWTNRGTELCSETDASDVFVVAEDWTQQFSGWPVHFDYHTFAVRSLETGKLKYRTYENADTPWLNHKLTHRNRNGTLVINEEGVVCRLPLRVNWTLIAICQSILAAPLLLLAAILYWRRRGSTRMAPDR